MTTYYSYQKTPIGQLLLAGDGDYLELLGLPSGKMKRAHEATWVEDDKPFREVAFQLDSYFAGALKEFDLPLAPKGTEFQAGVWNALTKIPYAETWSYGELAAYIGNPKASRAVGAANGLNPIPVISPCHRVIGANGKLTGFGGGLDTKQYLLGLEAESINPGLKFA